MKKSKLLSLLAAGVAVTTLAACSGGSNNSCKEADELDFERNNAA